MRRIGIFLGGAALAAVSTAAAANNVAENHAWQFDTSADKVNKAAVLDMIEKKRNGYYAPPVYITNIDRQYNCSVSATATGNQGTNTNIANAPTTSGPSSSAVGNNNETDVDGWHASSDVASDQGNSGDVGSSVRGSVSTRVSGSPDQALNSTQTNSGDQSASVGGSTACQFANVLN